MNNNTRVRLHLSKQLFETLTREILAEAKKPNDGYSVAVKQPKMPKQSKSQATSPEVQKTDKEKTMEETNMPKAPSHEETDANQVYEKKDKVDEYVGVDQTQGMIVMLATLLGIGVPLATTLYKDLKGKSKEEKKKVLQSLASQMDKSKGVEEAKEEE